MTITITKSKPSAYLRKGATTLTSKDARFEAKFGRFYQCRPDALFELMSEIADYVNNTLNEACLFEVE